MREILFRGKRKDNGEWETGSLLVERMNTSDQQVMIADKMTSYPTLVLPETVGQYTGMKDKSGKKIFEFDICKAYIHISKVGKKELTGAICFEEGAFKFKCKRYIFNIYDLSASIEVIGNVFNSPELLEEDKT